MKLLIEQIDNTEYLTEGAGATKQYYIAGHWISTNKVNRNNRIYDKNIVKPEVERYIKEYINPNRAFGELGHPNTPTINLDRASHMIKELHEDGDLYWGKAKIMLEMPMGKIAKALIDEGAKIGVSTRALGTVRKKNGIDYVCENFKLSTAGDIVADPSAHDAWVTGIMENAEWMEIPGQGWVPKFVERTKKVIHTTTKKNREEIALPLMEEFFKNLGSNH